MGNSTTQSSASQDSQGRRVVAVGKRPAGQKDITIEIVKGTR